VLYKKFVWDCPKYMSTTKRFQELKIRQAEIKKIEKDNLLKKSDVVLTVGEKQEYQANLTSLRGLKRSIQKVSQNPILSLSFL
jgi:hypothetical protein